MVFYFWGSKQIAVLNSQPLWLGETLRLATQCMWIPTRMKKGLDQLSGRLIKPRCGGMEMQLCSLQRQLWIICFYLLKLHLKEMLLCVIWQKFGVYALCSHFWGLCEGAKPEQPGMVGWVPGWSWIAVESLAALYLHSPKLWVPEQVLALHPQQTHSISWGPVFPLNLFSTSQPSWAGGKERGGSGCTYLKHLSSLDRGDVIWENLCQCLKPCLVTKLSDASGDRWSLCAPCAAQSLTSSGSCKIQATHVHCGINSQVDDPNKKITIWKMTNSVMLHLLDRWEEEKDDFKPHLF